MLGEGLLADAGEVGAEGLVAGEVALEAVLAQARLQGEDLLRDLLVLPFDPFKLRFALVEVQTLCSELNVGDRLTLTERVAIV